MKVKKVQLEINGAVRSQKVNTFDATTGCDLEPWCEIHDDFKNLMNSWNVNNGAKMFEAYDSFVDGEASNQWKEIKRNANGQSIVEFERCVQEFVKTFSGPNVRETANAFLNDSDKVQKAFHLDVRAHARRLQTLF